MWYQRPGIGRSVAPAQQIVAIRSLIPVGIAVHRESVTRPALNFQLCSAFDRPHDWCRGRRCLSANIHIDTNLHDAGFLDEIERDRILLDLLDQVDKLIKIQLETGAGLVGTDLAMADDMIPIAGD